MTSEVRWAIGDGVLTRSETLTARTPITIRAWRMIVPSTATSTETLPDGTLLSAADGQLRAAVTTPWGLVGQVRHRQWRTRSRRPRRDSTALTYEARDVRVTPGQPVTWQLTLRPGL